MTIPVKWFHSGMVGAPATGTAVGTLISILDACLIDGFNVTSVNSLTYDSATGKCTATVGTGHGFEDHQVVLIEGANEAAYNGEVRVTVVDANTFTYVPATAPTAAAATGTITAKAAPIGGWIKAFSGVNKSAYQASSGLYLRVDDSLDVYGAAVSFYEAMTDVDTGTGQFGAGYWRKSDNNAAAMNKWRVIGDANGVYLSINEGLCVYAGQFESLMNVDPGEICLFSNPSNDPADPYNGACDVTTDGHAGRVWMKSDASAADYQISMYIMDGDGAATVSFGGLIGLQVTAKTTFLLEDQQVRGQLPGALAMLTFAPVGSVLYLDGVPHYTVQGRSRRIAINLVDWGR